MTELFTQANDLEELKGYILFTFFPKCESVRIWSHYTNAENARFMILDEGEHLNLRFTRADCFYDVLSDRGDKLECLHIIPLVKEACIECRAQGVLDPAIFEAIMQAVDSGYEVCNHLRKYYVFCLSSDRNNDYLIRNYACKNRKPGLIIDFTPFIEDFPCECTKTNHINDQCHYLMFDVIYDACVVKAWFRKLFAMFETFKTQDTSDYKTIKSIVIHAIANLSLAYKPEEYAKEKETRIVLNLESIYMDCSTCTCPVKAEKDSGKYIHVIHDRHTLYNKRFVNVVDDHIVYAEDYGWY